MHRSAKSALRTIGPAGILSAAACGREETPYKPMPAWSGKHASLPAPVSPPNNPIKAGDAYTIYGAIHQLRSLIHSKEVTAQPITVAAYVVDSNIRSEEHTSELQSPDHLVCRLLLEKKKQ